jgi:5-(carboxyamino)imidazole ribonucleotide synthase
MATAPRTGPRTGPVVAMVGAGQLAQMTHQAAIGLGVTLRVLTERADDPAVASGASWQPGSPDRLEDLIALAAGASVVTFDHEQIPAEHLTRLEAEGVVLAPGAAAKRVAQDKLHARRELTRLGYPVPPFEHAQAAEEVEAFAARHGWPVVAKTPRGGYDGRGVFTIADGDAARAELAGRPDGLLLEPQLQIERELAILIARSAGGETVAYPVVETVQQDAMCREILAPAPVPDRLTREAVELARSLATRIEATGIMAVELFQTADGLLVNELALRPHNSGHYSIEGCPTSQFEQHLRAVLGWPLGRGELRAPAAATVNVIGPPDGSDPASRRAAALAVPGAHVHLYGKAARPGRKLGHVTVCGQEIGPVRAAARRAAAELEGRAA